MMAREFEFRTVALVQEISGATLGRTPSWLQRPGKSECRNAWTLVKTIYKDLSGLELPNEMPPRERRTIDAVLVDSKGRERLFEVDETQHFNEFRARTLAYYPEDLPLGFDRQSWMKAAGLKKRLEGGGFGKPRPPLFPGENGRHRQRAFRDALADILPLQHGMLPTLRIAHWELPPPITKKKVAELLAAKLGPKQTQADQQK